MATDDETRDEKLKHDIKREAAKISVLSSGKIDKYEYPAYEEIFPSNQTQIIEQVKVACSRFRKAFEKQAITMQLNQGEKQMYAIEDNKKQLYNNQIGNNELLLSKEREIFKNIYNKSFNKID